MSDDIEHYDEKKQDNPDAPGDVNSQRSGLDENDSRQSQADVLSTGGVRMDDNVTPEQAEVIRENNAS
jgi:hypothetical protein